MDENRITVSLVCFFANDVLKKMWVYKILQNWPKSAKFLKTCYREKLQYLQGATSCKSTTKLEGNNKLGGGGRGPGGLANSFILANKASRGGDGGN